MSGRQCARTGLWVIEDFRYGYRIATTSWGPMNPLPRLAGDDPASWNRYDTPGSTIYLADTEEIAFAEMLSSFALKLGEVHPLQKDADFLGLSLEEYMAELAGEWDGQQNMQPGFLPRHWRDRRLLYRLGLQAPGWWVDVEHPDSIAAISGGIGKQLSDGAGLERLTLGVLHGENRTATTLIATWLRSLTLDDETEPVGIRFRSKHGGGYSWAYWLRRADTGLTGDPMTADDGTTIESNRPSLLAVTSRFNIKIW
ncbi:hypothetical protein [Arthrobacter sp. VKM Ac-2550]|uniref:hypothetical protein n=1 Tax=Crystallibacter permensis TaxID=1938888 RepID=UPI002226025D|nr:hypothetical protein [Arthrobacter sp. VKM Ac-2550]MCW2131349.1 hypothetical protein [Arthrobacter sp. VKM Ac-2550]